MDGFIDQSERMVTQNSSQPDGWQREEHSYVPQELVFVSLRLLVFESSKCEEQDVNFDSPSQCLHPSGSKNIQALNDETYDGRREGKKER